MKRYTNIEKFHPGAFDHVHLQWFAAEDEGRTEDPTEYKIRKAREEGKVAKSSEFTSALVLLFPIVALAILAPYVFSTFLEMIAFFFNSSTEIDITTEGQVTSVFLRYFLRITLPIGAVAFISAILGNVFQVGFLFTVKPIKPDLKKIVPKFGKFFKRALFSGEAFFNLGKSIIKIIIIGAIGFLNIRAEVDKIAHLLSGPVILGVSLIARVAFRIIVEAAIGMLILSLPDYLFQRRQHKESLKMTKHEVKEERKMHEGDPLVQSRLRERMRQILNRNMLQNVPKADVVVTNPTHFAVAMEYDRAMMNAPTITAKGQDNMALRIREIARDNSVPVIENKPLARALYAEVEIGDAIPEQYYEVMAHILAQVYRMQGSDEEAV